MANRSNYLDSCGRYRTRSLFVELIQKEQVAAGYKPVYSLAGDTKYEDLHELYMECGDPTEYEFAISAWGSWEHHERMVELDWFMEYLNTWRAELQVKMKSQAIKALMEVAVGSGNRGITAAKYIASYGWEKKAGRPSKADQEKAKRTKAGIDEETQDDAKRLGLHLVSKNG